MNRVQIFGHRWVPCRWCRLHYRGNCRKSNGRWWNENRIDAHKTRLPIWIFSSFDLEVCFYCTQRFVLIQNFCLKMLGKDKINVDSWFQGRSAVLCITRYRKINKTSHCSTKITTPCQFAVKFNGRFWQI